MTTISAIKKKYLKINPTLNEKSRRIWCATEAIAIGWGGIIKVYKATGVSRPTIQAGIKEISSKRGRPRKKRSSIKTDGRVRKKGGGAKSVLVKNPEILSLIETFIEPGVKGDPERPLLWTNKALRKLAAELQKLGHKVSHSKVGELLKEAGYSLQMNRKEKSGKTAPDRNAQFEHINEQTKAFHRDGDPVISVDTKKKEMIGEFKNGGSEYCKIGEGSSVNDHDFLDKKLGKVAPYGVYDIGKNKGWVNVGISSDTAEFAVNAIRAWWENMGKKDYANATKLMITADCGGSNGNRVRLWKWELQKLANQFALEIHVCHLPPGTSKWNKIEHKMFSYISKNWRAVPLISYEVVVQLIGNTKTTKGLQIQAQIDYREYLKGVEVEDKDFNSIAITKDMFHGEWNYTISPMLARKD